MGSSSLWHWIVVLIIIMIVFGTKKLGNIGTDLGRAIKGFKEGLKHDEEENKDTLSTTSEASASPAIPPKITTQPNHTMDVDVVVTEKNRTS